MTGNFEEKYQFMQMNWRYKLAVGTEIAILSEGTASTYPRWDPIASYY